MSDDWELFFTEFVFTPLNSEFFCSISVSQKTINLYYPQDREFILLVWMEKFSYHFKHQFRRFSAEFFIYNSIKMLYRLSSHYQ